jgi:hypothetical protein
MDILFHDTLFYLIIIFLLWTILLNHAFKSTFVVFVLQKNMFSVWHVKSLEIILRIFKIRKKLNKKPPIFLRLILKIEAQDKPLLSNPDRKENTKIHKRYQLVWIRNCQRRYSCLEHLNNNFSKLLEAQEWTSLKANSWQVSGMGTPHTFMGFASR